MSTTKPFSDNPFLRYSCVFFSSSTTRTRISKSSAYAKDYSTFANQANAFNAWNVWSLVVATAYQRQRSWPKPFQASDSSGITRLVGRSDGKRKQLHKVVKRAEVFRKSGEAGSQFRAQCYGLGRVGP